MTTTRLATAARPDPLIAGLRLAVLLLIALAGLLYGGLGFWWTTLPDGGELVSRAGIIAGGDFAAFWGAASLAASGAPASPYDPVQFRATLGALVPTIAAPFSPWAYPPIVLVLFRPLAWFSPAASLWLWMAAMLFCAIAAAAIASRRLWAAPAALAFPPVIHAIICGQNGPLTALLLAVLIDRWNRSPRLAGLAIALLSYKPHFAVVPAILAIATRAWEILAWAAGAAIALAALSVAIDGLAPWWAFLDQTRAQMIRVADEVLPIARMVTVFALAHALRAPMAVVIALHTVVAVGALAVAARLWRRTDDPFTRALALASATILVTPYAFDYDLAILIVPAAMLLRGPGRAFALDRSAMRWIVVLSLGPLAAVIAMLAWGVQGSALLMVGLLAAIHHCHNHRAARQRAHSVLAAAGDSPGRPQFKAPLFHPSQYSNEVTHGAYDEVRPGSAH